MVEGVPTLKQVQEKPHSWLRERMRRCPYSRVFGYSASQMSRISKILLILEAEQLVMSFSEHAGLESIGERSIEQSIEVRLPRNFAQSQEVEFDNNAENEARPSDNEDATDVAVAEANPP